MNNQLAENSVKVFALYILMLTSLLASLLYFSEYFWPERISHTLPFILSFTDSQLIIYFISYVVFGVFLIFAGICLVILPLQRQKDASSILMRLEKIKMVSLSALSLIAGPLVVAVGLSLLFHVFLLKILWPIWAT